MPERKPAILFVCLGNICRSPLAEAAFRAEAARSGLDAEADSAGTGSWHVGAPPDRRAQAVASRNGIDIAGYRARQVTPDDFARFTHIVALDRDNLTMLERMRARAAEQGETEGDANGTALSLLLDHVPDRAGEAVADPYHGPDSGFETTWADVTAGARALVAKLAR